ERLLANTDLQRSESGTAADAVRDDLINRWSSGAASGKRLARHQRAHRAMVTLAVRIIEAADDVYVLLEGRQRLQARRDLVIRPRLARHPVVFQNAVAVEPQNESGLDWLGCTGRGAYSRPTAVEHRGKRRHADLGGRSTDSDTF